MIQTFIQNIDSFYEITNIPIFILDINKIIIAQPQNFFSFPKDCFRHLLNSSIIRWKKIGILSTKSDILFFIQYKNHTICFGPMLLKSIYPYKSIKEIVFFNFLKNNFMIEDVYKRCINFDNQSFSYIQIVYNLLTNESLTIEDIRKILHENKQSESENDIREIIITKKDYNNKIYTYLEEQQFLKYIRTGDSISARNFGVKLLQNNSELLSNDQLQSLKYKVTAAITLMTREVIKINISLEDAYGTSDIYIRKVDSANSLSRLNEVFMRSIIDFCSLVKKNTKSTYPFWTRNCIEYINQNLHKNIKLDDIAKEINMNPKYISVQFKKITGEALVTYINRKKIEESQFLLRSTKLSILEISIILNFTDQSHFTKVFKKYANLSPKQYRDRFNKYE